MTSIADQLVEDGCMVLNTLADNQALQSVLLPYQRDAIRRVATFAVEFGRAINKLKEKGLST